MLYRNIAVLLTCYNRREITINCLTSLYRQKLSQDILLDVYLVDDGSIDGTAQAVSQQFPNVKIITGNGNLFWSGGMRLAWTEAGKSNYDAYLWLNDDTLLESDAIAILLQTSTNISKTEGCNGIIVGSCCDPNSGKQTYGGRSKSTQNFISPSDRPQKCDLMNGNIVLIPGCVFNVIGNISPEFIHLGGDNDYGQRAIKAGFNLWVAPGYLGKCESHTYIPWADPAIPLRERLRFLYSPKGQHPYEVYIYARRHNGFFWPMDLVKLYLRVLFPGFYQRIKQLMKT